MILPQRTWESTAVTTSQTLTKTNWLKSGIFKESIDQHCKFMLYIFNKCLTFLSKPFLLMSKLLYNVFFFTPLVWFTKMSPPSQMKFIPKAFCQKPADENRINSAVYKAAKTSSSQSLAVKKKHFWMLKTIPLKQSDPRPKWETENFSVTLKIRSHDAARCHESTTSVAVKWS